MSHFTKVRTKIKNREALVKALADMGFKTVETHEVAQPLYGFEGSRRSTCAEVIVRRGYVGFASNDIGFCKTSDGSYDAIVSDYDRTKYDETWLGKLTQRYAYHSVVSQLAQQGYTLESEKSSAGKIQLCMRRR